MLDMKFIREHAEEVKENLVNRHNPFDLDHVLDLDQKRRELLQQTEVLKSQKNAATIIPTIHARITMMIGSIADVSAFVAASTSSS